MPMQIDQVGLPDGEPGFARNDGLSTGALVTLTDTTPGGTTTFDILWVNPDDVSAAASLQQYGPDSHVWAFQPTAGVAGPIRIQLTHTAAGVVTKETRIFGIPNDDGVVPPAPGERSDPNATILNANDPDVIARCERNWKTDVFPNGNPFGWSFDLAVAPPALPTGPTGPAGGHLSGSYPDPHVIAFQNGEMSLSFGVVDDGQVLIRDGDEVVGADFSAEPTGEASGDLDGEFPGPQVVAFHLPDERITFGPMTDGQFLKRVGNSIQTEAVTGAPSGSAGGDLGGTYPNPTVPKVHANGVALTLAAIADGQMVVRSGTNLLGQAQPTIPTTLPPNGSAGGDLGSSFPNPTVVALHASGVALALGAIADGQMVVRSGANLLGQAQPSIPTTLPPNGSAGGDLAGSFPNPTVAALHTGATQLTVGTVADGEFVKRSGTALVSAAISVPASIYAAPSTAHADDDEFTGTTINAAWKAWRVDTMAAITPTVGVDAFSNFSTAGAAKWQQGYRDSWLSVQSPDRNNNSHQADLVVSKSLSAVGTNATFRIRWSTLSDNKMARDGAFTFRVCADASGKPDANNNVFLSGSINPGTSGNTTVSFGTTIAGTQTFATWTLQADSNQKSSLWAPIDEFLIVKRGTQYYGFFGCGGRWIRVTATGAIASQQYLSSITLAHVAMICTCDTFGGVNIPVQTMHIFDYFRRRDDLVIP